MAFDIKRFDQTGSGSKGVPKIATYITDDAAATVEGSGYFNEVATGLRTGDAIYAVMDDAVKIYTITVAAGVVTLGDELEFAAGT